jgi:hypothetical protein
VPELAVLDVLGQLQLEHQQRDRDREDPVAEGDDAGELDLVLLAFLQASLACHRGIIVIALDGTASKKHGGLPRAFTCGTIRRVVSVRSGKFGGVRVILGALALALIGAVALVPAALANPTPGTAVEELNTWRGELGEGLVSTTTVGAWNTGCNHHDYYEHQNGNALTHEDLSGNAGHTTDGAEAAVDSVLGLAVSAPSPTPDASLLPGPTWDGAVFHRAALLDPRLAQIGYDSSSFLEGGVYRTFSCLWLQNQNANPPQALDNSRTTPGLALYPSPGNGAYDVPTAYPGGEAPDPTKETGVPAGSTLGWLLNVEINGPWAGTGSGYSVYAHGVSATLAPDGTSNSVPLVVSECGPSGCGGGGGTSDGAYFKGGFGLFPTQPLAADTTYRVTLTGGVVTDAVAHVDYPLSGYSWCFSTGSSYTPSADCAAPSTAAEEPANPNASTSISITPPPPAPGGDGGSGSGGSGGSAPGGGNGSSGGGSNGSTSNPAAPTPGKPTSGPASTSKCTVPNLKGASLPAARKKLAAAHCALGKVHEAKGAGAGAPRVVGQGAKPKATLAAGTKVAITLGTAHRHAPHHGHSS